MIIVWIIAAVMLTTAAAVTMFRLLAGPSTLDRLVALDTLVAVTMSSALIAISVRRGVCRRRAPGIARR